MIPEPSAAVAVVDNDAALTELAEQLGRARWLAVDTEFLRERTYYARLCLVQIADERRVACIDPLAIADLKPLAKLLTAPGILKVFHAAGQDLEVLTQAIGAVPQPVFDTQVAAALLGQPDQIGYARLVETMLDVRLEKAHTRTDWSKRPLSRDEIRYAADDVLYLARLYPRMHKQLLARGRLRWLDHEFAELSDPKRYQPRPAEAWRRVKGLRKLRPAQQQALARLAAWREHAAIAADRPRGWIVKDEVLAELARRQPQSSEELARIRGLADSTLRKHGDSLLECIAAAANSPDTALESPPRRLSAQAAVLADLLMTGLKARAVAIDISAGALSNRREIEQLVAGERDLPILRGWRRAAAGQTLIDLLEGRLQLRAVDDAVAMQAADNG